VSFFLDSDTCIDLLRGGSERSRASLLAKPPSEIAVPSIVEAELLFGALRSVAPKVELAKVRSFLGPLRVEPFGSAAAAHYAIVRADLEALGAMIGANDLVVAATVLACGGTLVTGNTREFSRVAGLQLEDWR
jgi:tRNA(fMet)-specific endonuclease VapC